MGRAGEGGGEGSETSPPLPICPLEMPTPLKSLSPLRLCQPNVLTSCRPMILAPGLRLGRTLRRHIFGGVFVGQFSETLHTGRDVRVVLVDHCRGIPEHCGNVGIRESCLKQCGCPRVPARIRHELAEQPRPPRVVPDRVRQTSLSPGKPTRRNEDRASRTLLSQPQANVSGNIG